jgi:hypothetical protein
MPAAAANRTFSTRYAGLGSGQSPNAKTATMLRKANGGVVSVRLQPPSTRRNRRPVRATWRFRFGAAPHPIEAIFVPPIVADYLRKARRYTGPIPPVLRQLTSAKHPTGTYTPAMIALVEHVDHGPVAVHRTFLRADGSGKADLGPNKMTLGPSKGAAVQLAKPRDGVLAVAEGLESALSYMQATAAPTWAALSAVGIRNLVLPRDVTEVIIAADPDPVGLMAARAAARRWLDEGRRVSIARPPLGLDFNDLLRRAA